MVNPNISMGTAGACIDIQQCQVDNNCGVSYNHSPLQVSREAITLYSETCIKAAGDKLLMNKFIRQNFGGGRTLKSFRS